MSDELFREDEGMIRREVERFVESLIAWIERHPWLTACLVGAWIVAFWATVLWGLVNAVAALCGARGNE